MHEVLVNRLGGLSRSKLDFLINIAGPHSAIGRAPDSQVRGPGFDTQSGNILSFLFPLFQEGHLSVPAKVCARSTG